MGLHSGKWAAVNGISTNRQWTLNETQNPAKGIASNTGFAPKRSRGVSSWSGSYMAYGATPACMPGTLFGFVGYSAPDDDTSGNGQRFEGNALVDSIAITWNYGSGEYLGHVVNFSGHLALNTTVGAMPADASAPDMPPVALTKIQSGAPVAPTYADIPNIVTATLTITSANQSFVNSSTIVDGVIWTGRKAGTVDWTLALSQQDNLRVSAPFNTGDNLSLKLFSDASLFWLLQWGHVREFTGVEANRETGAIVARTINIDMTALNTTALGTITEPNGTVWWPFP
jgi:hypothetical protein